LEVSLVKTGDWWLGDPNHCYFKAAEDCLGKVWNQKVVYSREGGTIPITTRLEKLLSAPAIHLPIGQSSDAQHLGNERIRLENLMKGKQVIVEFFKRVGQLGKQNK
jgi:di- and tripeptidase